MSKLQPPEKGHPHLPSNPAINIEILSSPTFLKILWKAQPSFPLQQKMVGVCTTL